MAVLSAARRKKLAARMFGLPDERAYPMPDREHAANAKARARQQYNKGNLTKTEYNRIVRKANKKLGKPLGTDTIP